MKNKYIKKKIKINNKKNKQLLNRSLGIITLTSGLFFLSSNFTGNVIGSLNQTSSNLIGIILFLIGLFGAFFGLKQKK